VEEEMKGILYRASDFLFGCPHRSLSRPFTINGRTYEVCLDCGARFTYSLETMARGTKIAALPIPQQREQAA
jgi:hypothetical protein